MTNLEAIRTMSARKIAGFMTEVASHEFKSLLCSKKTCKWANEGVCDDEFHSGFCIFAAMEWLEREIDMRGYNDTSFGGRSHRKLWEREKITRYIKKGCSGLYRNWAWRFQKPKVTGRLKKDENKETAERAV